MIPVQTSLEIATELDPRVGVIQLYHEIVETTDVNLGTIMGAHETTTRQLRATRLSSMGMVAMGYLYGYLKEHWRWDQDDTERRNWHALLDSVEHLLTAEDNRAIDVYVSIYNAIINV